MNIDWKSLERLNNEVTEKYDIWRKAQHDHLTAACDLADAKFARERAIDTAYASEQVIGKNEREREAHLRQLLAQEYGQVDALERKVRITERTLRDAEIVVATLDAQIKLTRGVYGLAALGD